MTGVLISGGLGYVGGRIAQSFAAKRGIVPALGTRRHGPVPPWLPGTKLVHTDFESVDALASACEGFDTVVHLAAMNENDCIEDPVGALLANGVGTARMVEAAVHAGVERFIYVSTAHIYGAPLVGRITEKSLPKSRHPYASSHRAAEDCVLAAHDAGRLMAAVLRLSNGFGAPAHPGVDRWTLLVNDLCFQAVTSKRLVLRSAGLDQRDFIPLGDVAGAVIHVSELTREALDDGIFNVGAGRSMRVIEVVEKIADRCQAVLGFRPSVTRPDPLDAMPPELYYCVDKLLATGFRHCASMDGEIDATLTLCREAFGEPS